MSLPPTPPTDASINTSIHTYESTLPYFNGFTNLHIAIDDYTNIFARVRPGTSDVILVMIHGYPQSSWMYRYATKYLPKEFTLFIPDIPGYGFSTINTPTSNIEAYNKLSHARSILHALDYYLNRSPGGSSIGCTSDNPQKIILLGHDRGARITQRIGFNISEFPQFDILGIFLADIVPIVIQFSSLADPIKAVSTFHWAFLAAQQGLPEGMIQAFGGEKWVEYCLGKWGGSGPGAAHGPAETAEKEKIEEGVYVHSMHFKKQSVVEASCADYRAAAHSDAEKEKREWEDGERIQVPTGVVFSEKYLGSRYDVPGVWKEWIAGDKLKTYGLGNGVGHFCFEEAPEMAYGKFNEWVKDVLEMP
ncbi:Alpha/Beta hydrolase protein [Pyronema domesticum]|nr:Alpha/Beta hydrolase protein [Pyronema domesticum]